MKFNIKRDNVDSQRTIYLLSNVNWRRMTKLLSVSLRIGHAPLIESRSKVSCSETLLKTENCYLNILESFLPRQNSIFTTCELFFSTRIETYKTRTLSNDNSCSKTCLSNDNSCSKTCFFPQIMVLQNKSHMYYFLGWIRLELVEKFKFQHWHIKLFKP